MENDSSMFTVDVVSQKMSQMLVDVWFSENAIDAANYVFNLDCCSQTDTAAPTKMISSTAINPTACVA